MTRAYVVTALTAAVVLLTAATANAAATFPQPDLEAAAQKAIADNVRPSADRSASVAKSKKVKRTKLGAWEALAVTEDTAFYQFLYDPDAYNYGAYGCDRHGKFDVTCIGYVDGTIYAPDFSAAQNYTCDWWQDVWVNRKNLLGTWGYEFNCFFTSEVY